MKTIHILIPRDKKQIVETVLNSLEIKYSSIEDKSNALIMITLPDEVVESVTDEIKKVGVGTLYGYYHIFTSEVSSMPKEIISEDIAEVLGKTKRISREEIISSVRDMAELNRSYILYSILAAILAALGLLSNNVVMIIASMIVAPYMGPIVGTSIGIVTNDSELKKESFTSGATGIGIAIIIGFIVTFVTPFYSTNSAILLRSNPTYLDLIFALVAGLAAALSVASVTSLTLIGVAIAASLAPPAANIGVGIGLFLKGNPEGINVILGSTLLLSINILAIVTMGLIYFWIEGVSGMLSIRKRAITTKKIKNRIFLFAFLFLIISIPVMSSTYQHYLNTSLKNSIKEDVIREINSKYSSTTVLNVTVILQGKNSARILVDLALSNTNIDLHAISEHLDKVITEKYSMVVEVFIKPYYY